MPTFFSTVAKPVDQRLTVSYNATAGKLRIGDIDDRELIMLTRGEHYKLDFIAPVGCVVVPTMAMFPSLAQNLQAQGIVQIVERLNHRLYDEPIHIARVLIQGEQ